MSARPSTAFARHRPPAFPVWLSVISKRHVERHVGRHAATKSVIWTSQNAEKGVIWTSQNWQALFAMLFAAVAALIARILTGPHPIDDAFITFRYARNLAEGLGLVYNPGEWVLGTTTPLWAALLGAGYRLGLSDLPWLSSGVSAACDAATVILLVRLAMRMGWRPLGAGLVGLAWALNPMSIGFATGGMETSLFVLFAVATLSLAAGRRFIVPAAALSGLATLVRPEGALLALTVVAWAWLVQRRQAPGAVLAAAVPVLVVGGLFMARYGSPLPHSVAAKQVAYQPAWPLENAFALTVQAGLPGWSTYLLAVLPAAAAVALALAGLTLLVGLTLRGVHELNRHEVAWQPFAGFAVLYMAFYVAVGLRGVRMFPWYLVPITPFYLLALAAGLARVRAWRQGWLAAALVVWQLPAISWHQPLMPAGEDLAREQLYLSVGQYLAGSLPVNAVVAAPEIGAIGYASNLRMLDTVGLVSPAALPYYPLPADQVVTDNAIPPRLINDQKPDAVVTLDAFVQRSLLLDAAFQHDYRLEASYPANVWQSQELLVFRRIDDTQ